MKPKLGRALLMGGATGFHGMCGLQSRTWAKVIRRAGLNFC
ncbi:hypothetical protein [Fumia xinanensis]|nr:hypothetical protein [Fumia xinanensis]